MSNTKKEWISNWLISNSNGDNQQEMETNGNGRVAAAAAASDESVIPMQKNLSKVQKKTKFKSKSLTKLIEDSELTVSPVSGTFIIKEWNSKLKNKLMREQEEKHSDGKNGKSSKKMNEKFTNDEVMLNSVASNYVQITDEAKMKLSKIVNCIGPYECKLCKVVYNDAFELAMHNCPRVVHFEYRCSECKKVFNCPANLASHKRWHKPRAELNALKNDKEPDASEQTIITGAPNNNGENVKSTEQTEAKQRLFEKMPKIFEENPKESRKQHKSYTSQATLSQYQTNGPSAFHESQQVYTGYLNNTSSEWLSEVYRNYFAAAAVYLQTKQFHQSPAASTSEMPSTSTSSLFYHPTSCPPMNQPLDNRQFFTCKYCYSTFTDNFSLIFHIRKSHSSILLNFN